MGETLPTDAPADEPLLPRPRLQRLIEQARTGAPVPTAVVHPTDALSLLGAREAADAKLIVPILVGPEAKIRAAAREARLDLFMKGALHTDELMSAVLERERGKAGNLLAKELEYLAGAQLAGVVLGARVPIVLTSRADPPAARLAACAIAVLLARQRAPMLGAG